MTTPNTYALLVQGMSCQHCVKAVTTAIQDEDPTADVRIDLPTGRVDVQTVLDEAQVRALIAEEGYSLQT